MAAYVKAIVAVLGGLSAWGITAAADNNITAVEVYGLLGTLATALAVYAFPNRDPADDGQSSLLVILVVVILVVVLLRLL